MPACLAPPPTWAAGPWLVPKGPGEFGPSALLGDLDWDPFTQTLWACDAVNGDVGNWVPGPSPVLPGLGFFAAAPASWCPLLTLSLVGIAVDRGRPGDGVFWVTDGSQLAYMHAGGTQASTSLYATSSCYKIQTPMLSGLAATPLKQSCRPSRVSAAVLTARTNSFS